MKTPKCLPALLLGFCLVCPAGTTRADENGAAGDMIEVKAENASLATAESAAEVSASAASATEVRSCIHIRLIKVWR